MMVSQDFCKSLNRFVLVVLTVSGLAALAFGILILLHPALFLQIFLYALGGIILLLGMGTLGSLLRALLSE